MNNRNVLLVRNVANDGFGGGEVYQLKLAEGLKEHGFCPVIVTNSKKLFQCAKEKGFEAVIPPYLKQQNWSGWRNIMLPRYWFFQKRLERWYLEVLKKYRPTVINIQSRDDMIAGTLACKKMGVRVLWTDHADFRNWVLWNVNEKYKNVIGKTIIKLSFDVEKVIFVSEEIKKETAKMIAPQELKNSIVIENGVYDKLDEYKNVKMKKNSFVFVGRVVEEKGIAELIKAFRVVVEKFPDAKLDVYGEGDIDRFQKMCSSDDRVRFHGRTNDPLMAMAENEVFVLPSHREGLSLSLLEATMMEKRIIASRVDGNLEVVTDGESGLLVPTKNVAKLSEAMMWMLDNKKEAKTMSRKARRTYEERFDLRKIIEEKMLPLYNCTNKEEK